jgi:hypothetical protein
MGGWVVSTSGLGAMEKRKIFYPYREPNPYTSIIRLVA